MFGKRLCSKCAVGKYMRDVDEKEPFCPYLYCYGKKKCTMFKRAPKESGFDIFKLFKKG